MAKKKVNPVLNQIQTEEWQRKRIRTLLANLCYVPTPDELREQGVEDTAINRIPEMGEYRLTPQMLFLSGMTPEAQFLEAIEALVGQGLSPTFEAVEDTLAHIAGSPEQASEIAQRIQARRSYDRDVTGLAASIAAEMQTKYLGWVLRDLADNVIDGPYGNYREKFEQVVERVTQLAPVEKRDGAVTYDELWDAIRSYMRTAVERRRAGKSMGPQYPWKAVRRMVRGGMEKGDLHLWTGPTKIGKTTIASEIGRHIAMEQDDYLVVQLHLETSPLTLGAREVCRALMVQPGDIREGLIDPDDPYWQDKFDRAERRLTTRCGAGDNCRYVYEYRPGLSFEEFRQLVRVYSAKAEGMGLELVVILDYFQEMDWTDLQGAHNETAGLNILATKLKEVADDYGIYLIVFAQEADDKNDNTNVYMAKKIIKRAQAHFSMFRGEDKDTEEASVDLPVMQYDENNKLIANEMGWPVPKPDGMGNPMYWHRKGEPNSYMRIHLVRGNNVAPGWAYLQVANGYFLVKEAAPPSVTADNVP